ncbi:hypothetical protein BC629DRAFT_1444980 [Irpex lacteus]|nr:hypothetical protein BC629DRAFT_1444980 [Irpex lacteus]
MANPRCLLSVSHKKLYVGAKRIGLTSKLLDLSPRYMAILTARAAALIAIRIDDRRLGGTGERMIIVVWVAWISWEVVMQDNRRRQDDVEVDVKPRYTPLLVPSNLWMLYLGHNKCARPHHLPSFMRPLVFRDLPLVHSATLWVKIASWRPIEHNCYEDGQKDLYLRRWRIRHPPLIPTTIVAQIIRIVLGLISNLPLGLANTRKISPDDYYDINHTLCHYNGLILDPNPVRTSLDASQSATISLDANQSATISYLMISSTLSPAPV